MDGEDLEIGLDWQIPNLNHYYPSPPLETQTELKPRVNDGLSFVRNTATGNCQHVQLYTLMLRQCFYLFTRMFTFSRAEVTIQWVLENKRFAWLQSAFPRSLEGEGYIKPLHRSTGSYLAHPEYHRPFWCRFLSRKPGSNSACKLCSVCFNLHRELEGWGFYCDETQKCTHSVDAAPFSPSLPWCSVCLFF